MRGGVAVRYGPTNKRGARAADELPAESLVFDPGEKIGGINGVVRRERVKLPLTGGGGVCY